MLSYARLSGVTSRAVPLQNRTWRLWSPPLLSSARDTVVSRRAFSEKPPNDKSYKKIGWNVWISILISLPSACLGSWITATMMATANEELEEKKKSNAEEIKKLSYALEKAKMTDPDVKHYVPVTAVKEINLQRDVQDSTVLIHGPRGVGKTTVMQVALQGIEGVVHIQPSPLEVDNVYNSILSVVGIKSKERASDMFIISALKEIKNRGGTKPTFVVEVNEKCNEKQLMAILIEMKKLVADSKLSSGFVVLSSSRAALLLPVTLHELRVCPVSISDPPPRIIMDYLEKALSELFPGSKREEREGWISSYSQQIGSRFLDAVNLLVPLKVAKVKKDRNMEDVLEEFVTERKETYLSSALKFIAMINEKKKKEVLKGILNEDLPLDKLVEATGKDEVTLVKTLTDLHPHPVYIDLRTSLVGVGNFVSSEEFKKFIK